ncbi:MAG TPA: hypothetical protein VN660_13420 [Steroidobacteraceae bacterium]|nr:hypothetical protein [Steroidobacteraceae bacterium]
MNDTELAGTWAALEPTTAQRRRMQARVQWWLDAHGSSLISEWLGLLKINPIVSLSLATAAAGLLLIATPLSWVAFSVL